MNDIRVTKGVARYTSNFDPRTLPQAAANRVIGLSTLGTPYTFRARSVNSVGSSEYSSSTTSAITTLGAPSNLNIIIDSDKAYLSWTPPTSNNSAIRDYSIQYSSNNGNTWTDYVHSPSITTSIVVDGLTVGTSYSFRVAAVNMAGVGAYVTSASPVLTALREDNTYNKTRLLLHLDSN
jgi:titin